MANTMICLCFPFLFFSNVLLLCILPLHCAATYCLGEGYNISSTDVSSHIISSNEMFEAGFFTPDESLGRSKYLGIWYHFSNPKIIVWVANREKPVLEPNASLFIEDGNAKVLGRNGTAYWSSTPLAKPQPLTPPNTRHLLSTTNISNDDHTFNDITSRRCQASNRCVRSPLESRLCLEDGGNLILYDAIITDKILWQSFVSPTIDTFLPGMSSDTNFFLTSWKSRDNPASGDYTLQLQEDSKKLVVKNKTVDYWESGVTPFDMPPPELFTLLEKGTDKTTRLVMSFTGQIQFWRGGSNGQNWSLVWEEPKDRCSQADVCGVFGSCNSNNGILCKCLPGFKPDAKEKWNARSFSDGCQPNSEIASPGARSNSMDDIFLKLPMMRIGQPSYNESHDDCEKQCLNETTCLAYSCGAENCTSSHQKRCMKWSSNSDRPTNLQEEYSEGIIVFIRTTRSDLGSNSRSCNPCGAYIIPYPLSTAANCGDPSYFHFRCNEITGQVSFSVPESPFNVTSIDPDGSKFFIQPGQTSCDSGFMNSLKSSVKSFPFSVKNCGIFKDQSFGFERSYVEIEMGWDPSPEPTCNRTSDCRDWSDTICKTTKGEQKRCYCSKKFKRDGPKLQCIEVKFPRKVVLASVAGALAFILLCGAFFIHHHIQKKRVTRKQSSDVFKGDDTESIDVPSFNWEIILTATDNFADANKLGTGGFGAVYRGMLPDGKEIAVKRLSGGSVQGVEEFKTEVVLIAKLQHRNLVRLLGYCIKEAEKILLYEFVPHGSLDSCLFDQTCSVVLDWVKRFDIIFGIARGLLYLHEDSRLKVIHRDLKPSNILLDEELNPKISDFGIARIIGGKETEGSTKRVVGTYGYMSPEYAYEGLFSVKSDVFSFGVVVLEIISGRRNSKLFQLEFGVTLLGQAWKLWTEGSALDLLDQTLKESCKSSEVLKCIHIALLCVQEEPSDRPTMSAVLLMLSSENASLPPPKQPAFSAKKQPSRTASSSSMRDSSLSDMITLSTEGR